jgi:hypothetical protein
LGRAKRQCNGPNEGLAALNTKELTPLPISKHAEGSAKGKFNRKIRYGRQLARVFDIVPKYLYPYRQV